MLMAIQDLTFHTVSQGIGGEGLQELPIFDGEKHEKTWFPVGSTGEANKRTAEPPAPCSVAILL